MNKKFFMSAFNGSAIPEQPVGSIVFYWYGTGGSNWSEVSDPGTNHTLTLNADHLEIQRTDSGGGIGTAQFQTSEAYTDGSGKTLYIRYEITAISGTIDHMQSNLKEIGGSGEDLGAQIEITSFAVDGDHLVNSSGTTSPTSGYSPHIEFRSTTATFTAKIYELYYL